MHTSSNQPNTSRETSWAEEWVLLSKVIRHGPLQVRKKLDIGAVRRYADMTKAGSAPPPIKVGRVGGVLYLVDGWHRLEAGAIQTQQLFTNEPEVRALVAEMTEEQARWEAAKANLGHGVPLKPREYRTVFRAFIRAKKHHKEKKRYMSYREMAAALGVGVGHTTLRNWTMKDFPRLAHALGGNDHGNTEGQQPPPEGRSLDEEHCHEAHRALQALAQHATAISDAKVRWELLQGLEDAAGRLRAAGVERRECSMF